jgi:hypothetical protein
VIRITAISSSCELFKQINYASIAAGDSNKKMEATYDAGKEAA